MEQQQLSSNLLTLHQDLSVVHQKNLDLRSDASTRFEKGVDPNRVVAAAERAAQLMAELAGGKCLQDLSLLMNSIKRLYELLFHRIISTTVLA